MRLCRPLLQQSPAAVPPPRAISRLSRVWIPTGGIEQAQSSAPDAQALLVKAGFVRQAHAGIFHMLPLGLRVQHKIEALIDKHMVNIGASKVSLSSISSEHLWKKTGRFVGHGGELFSLQDRRGSRYLLSPTHEEEITALVAGVVHSSSHVPLRLYQISRKYRDEARPRQGLLRGREFTMKDLYTFDTTEAAAQATYETVRTAYRAFFDELGLPYLVARADSGAMGGNLSHEYHFVSARGEDDVLSCEACGEVINEELAVSRTSDPSAAVTAEDVQHWCGVSNDRRTLVVVCIPRLSNSGQPAQVNLDVVKTLFPDLDAAVETPLAAWNTAGTVVELVDGRVSALSRQQRIPSDPSLPSIVQSRLLAPTTRQLPTLIDNHSVQLTKPTTGDPCPSCGKGSIHIDRAIEIGHTFHLGTRYSGPLDACIDDRSGSGRIPLQMGCHGIGVSRLVGAVAAVMADERGLNWPVSIAPFGVVVVAARGCEADAEEVAGRLQEGLPGVADVVLDDREKSFVWKLNDADLIGYPVIAVLGRAWKERRSVEVQCRRLGLKEEVPEAGLEARLTSLVQRL